MSRRVVAFVLALMVAPLPAVGDEGVLLAAIALACVAQPVALDAMAAGLPGDVEALDETALEFGGETVGWTRRFEIEGGAIVSLTRIAPFATLRRIEAELAAPAGGDLRPTMVAIAGPDCVVGTARRLIYDAAGDAEAIEMLDPALVPTGRREALNPPLPAGRDPGGVTVALVDSGVNYLLPVIAERLARDAEGRALGYDYWDLDDRPFDANPTRSPFFPQRHGTKVASVIIAEAPAVRLLPYRYPRDDPARFEALIEDAAANGARIVNMAMGSNSEDHWRGFVAGVAAHPEILFVVSAGNDGRNLDRRPVYPAAYNFDNMLVIGSADGFGEPAWGSNWGKATVDLMVPGERVPVIEFSGAAGVASGASYAAPRIAALAARLLAANPDWTTAELKDAILSRARIVDGVGPLTTRYGFIGEIL